MRHRLWLMGLALVPWLAALGQGGSLEAAVDRDTIRANESFRYILTATGQLGGRPDFSALGVDFDVLGPPRSRSSIQIFNGRTTQVAEWIVELMPKAAGTYELPAVAIDGRLSNPVTVEVLPAPEDTGASADVFIEVDLDREQGYVQAQAIYTLRLFVGVGTGRQTLTAPLIEGGEAIVEKLGADREYQTARGGRNYNVRERSYAVFPQSAGTLTIGPAVYEAMIVPRTGFARQQRLRSEVLELEVRPAVAPPPGYPDAAWLPAAGLGLTESWSDGPAAFDQGVPKTRTLTITAEGLLETQLPALTVEAVPGLRHYPDQPELEREITADGIEARRTERFAVIAQGVGTIELPAVELPWWNLEAERWEVARIEGRTIEVRPGERVEAPPPPDAGPAEPRTVDPGSRWWPWLAAGLAAGWLTTALAWFYSARMRPRRRAAAPPRSARRPSARSLLRQLGAACRVHDAPRTRDLLLEWAALQFAEDPPGSLGALAARLSEPLAGEVRALEAALYGPTPTAWRGETLAGLLRRTQSVSRARSADDEDPLVPLYR